MDTKNRAKSSKKTAEYYSDEAFAASQNEIITYDRKEDLEEWLEKYAPSTISKLDGIGYIQIVCEGGIDESDMDFENLRKDFQELKASENPVNFHSIKELAVKNRVVAGSWLCSMHCGPRVDFAWKKIATEFIGGCLKDVAIMVRVTPMDPDNQYGNHMFFVKQKDFTDEEEVDKLHKALRTAGIKTMLMYKPEMFSCLGIYRNNDFHIQPTIYTSVYDALKRESTLTCHVKEWSADAEDTKEN